MNHGSLFSGIGGFDLAAQWMGWNNIFHCEWNPFGQKVLKHHFPKSISYEDITKTDFSIHKGNIDILTGGFPCQPYSTAGLRKGKEDERHLFPEMLRAIKEIKPRWIVGENVRGLVSWNEGLVFNEVYDDLESEGYEVQSFLIPAAGVNAPHQRYRIWFVAYSNNYGTSAELGQIQGKNGEISEWNNNAEFSDTSSRNATDSNSRRLEGPTKEGWNSKYAKWENGVVAQKPNATDTDSKRSKECDFSKKSNESKFSNWQNNAERRNWENFPTKPPICGGNDGIPRELDSITFSKWRNESIKAYGNAIVPQVAYQIFKTINEFESLTKNK